MYFHLNKSHSCPPPPCPPFAIKRSFISVTESFVPWEVGKDEAGGNPGILIPSLWAPGQKDKKQKVQEHVLLLRLGSSSRHRAQTRKVTLCVIQQGRVAFGGRSQLPHWIYFGASVALRDGVGFTHCIRAFVFYPFRYPFRFLDLSLVVGVLPWRCSGPSSHSAVVTDGMGHFSGSLNLPSPRLLVLFPHPHTPLTPA